MISEEQFKTQYSQIYATLEDIWMDEGVFEVFYGYGAGQFGWFVVATDYPDFEVMFLGATFEEALEKAQQWHQEWQEENEEEEEEDEE